VTRNRTTASVPAHHWPPAAGGASSPLSRDFYRLWGAYSVSELGSAVGAGALPLVAILLLDSSSLQVSLLAVISGIASAVIVLPLGPWIEFRRKRPVMCGADLLRCAALASVPVAAALHELTYGQLCVVAIVQTAGGIAFGAASGAHLKNLVTTGATRHRHRPARHLPVDGEQHRVTHRRDPRLLARHHRVRHRRRR
jgi:MFS family permease